MTAKLIRYTVNHENHGMEVKIVEFKDGNNDYKVSAIIGAGGKYKYSVKDAKGLLTSGQTELRNRLVKQAKRYLEKQDKLNGNGTLSPPPVVQPHV